MDDKVTPINPQHNRQDGINPLIADNRKDTMERVASVLTYLSVLQNGNEGDYIEAVRDDKWRNGRSLVYRMLIHALTVQSAKRDTPS